MSDTIFISEDQLVSELWARDVRFLMGKRSAISTPQLTVSQLVAALAQSEDPRARFSLIPLFLRHPEYSADVTAADKALSTQASQLTLRFYYTAAVFLQRKYRARIIHIMGEQPQLADLFSKKLGVLSNKSPNDALIQLAKQHHALTGQFVNWLGTYEHAADVWLRQMELQKA